MHIRERLTKLILEGRNIQVNKKDIFGNDLNIEEIIPDELYKVSDELNIKFTEIDGDIYDLGIIVGGEEDPRRIGTLYKIDDNNWVAQSNINSDLNKEGNSMIDAAISLLSVEGII